MRTLFRNLLFTTIVVVTACGDDDESGFRSPLAPSTVSSEQTARGTPVPGGQPCGSGSGAQNFTPGGDGGTTPAFADCTPVQAIAQAEAVRETRRNPRARGRGGPPAGRFGDPGLPSPELAATGNERANRSNVVDTGRDRVSRATVDNYVCWVSDAANRGIGDNNNDRLIASSGGTGRIAIRLYDPPYQGNNPEGLAGGCYETSNTAADGRGAGAVAAYDHHISEAVLRNGRWAKKSPRTDAAWLTVSNVAYEDTSCCPGGTPEKATLTFTATAHTGEGQRGAIVEWLNTGASQDLAGTINHTNLPVTFLQGDPPCRVQTVHDRQPLDVPLRFDHDDTTSTHPVLLDFTGPCTTSSDELQPSAKEELVYRDGNWFRTGADVTWPVVEAVEISTPWVAATPDTRGVAAVNIRADSANPGLEQRVAQVSWSVIKYRGGSELFAQGGKPPPPGTAALLCLDPSSPPPGQTVPCPSKIAPGEQLKLRFWAATNPLQGEGTNRIDFNSECYVNNGMRDSGSCRHIPSWGRWHMSVRAGGGRIDGYSQQLWWTAPTALGRRTVRMAGSKGNYFVPGDAAKMGSLTFDVERNDYHPDITIACVPERPGPQGGCSSVVDPGVVDFYAVITDGDGTVDTAGGNPTHTVEWVVNEGFGVDGHGTVTLPGDSAPKSRPQLFWTAPGTGTFEIEARVSDGKNTSTARRRVRVVRNPASSLPTLTVDDTTVAEGETARLTATLGAAAEAAVAFDVTTQDGTATSESQADYLPIRRPERITIPAGSTTATITVETLSDDRRESSETFTVTLSNARGARITDGEGEVTITDATAARSLSIADSSASEGDALTFTVTLDETGAPARTDNVTVAYASTDDSAKGGTVATCTDCDYAATTGTLTFGTTETSKTFTVATKEDTTDEGARESFLITLSSPVGASIAVGRARGTITDDDDAPSGKQQIAIDDVEVTEGTAASFTVTRGAPTTGSVTVSYATADRTATAGADYTAKPSTNLTFAAGETSKTINVTTLQDTADEQDELFEVNLSLNTANAALAVLTDAVGIGTIQDDDEPPAFPTLSIGDASVTEGQRAALTVTGTPAPTSPVTFTYRTADESAESGSDYTAVPATQATMAIGSTTTTLHVDTTDDSVDEPTERFIVLLENESGADITGNGRVGTVTINDNDDDVALPTLSVGDATVEEGERTTVTVTLSTVQTSAVTASYRTRNGSARSGVDYSEATGTVTIAAGSTSTTISLSTTEDTILESTEQFEVVIFSPQGATLGDGTGTVTVTDDDVEAPPETVAKSQISVSDASVEEGGGAVFTLYRSAPLTNQLTVQVRTVTGTAGAADYTGISEHPIDLDQSSRSFTIQTTEDAEAEFTETFTVELSLTPTQQMFGELVDHVGIGTIFDDDEDTSIATDCAGANASQTAFRAGELYCGQLHMERASRTTPARRTTTCRTSATSRRWPPGSGWSRVRTGSAPTSRNARGAGGAP